jgi:halimadienyl-diphosphate synthase
LGIIKQQRDRILGKMKNLREQKLRKLAGIKINRYCTSAFSAEMAGNDSYSILDIENLQEINGSVANSPSATSYFAQRVIPGNITALNYIRETVSNRNGGAPFASPFNIFERAWVMWNLALVPSIHNDPTFKKQLFPHIEFLRTAWQPGKGVGFSNDYTPCDGDDTSVTFDALAKFGYLLDVETLLNYEDQEHFKCYDLEAHPSIGVNVHMLGALQQAGLDKSHLSIQKILKFIRQSSIGGEFWVDKWHISPYYMTCHIVIACKKLDPDICQQAINWIIRTQKNDGSWGYFGSSTAEETAYALQALKIWEQSNHSVDKNIISTAVQWLELHSHSPYPKLWISKALYCPTLVVESVILSALALCKE